MGWLRCPFRASLLAGALPLAAAACLWFSAPERSTSAIRRLLPQLSLIESFAAEPRRPMPDLWRQRLPPGLAEVLWRRSRGLWWQLWGSHAGPDAALLLPDHQELDDLPLSFKVGPYRLIAANALALQELKRRFRSPDSTPKQPHCPALIRRPGSVLWRADALQAMAGAWTPLLLPLRQGCLLSSGQRWTGAVGRLDGIPRPLSKGMEPPSAIELPPDVLLQLEGTSLQPLLGGLLSQGPMQVSLLKAHGLGPQLQAQLLAMPFVLQVRPNPPQSSFKATVVLRLNSSPEQAKQLETALERSLGQSPSLGVDSLVRGGWRRLESGQLLVALGGVPSQSLQDWAPLKISRNGEVQLKLLARPKALQRAGLLPPKLPAALRDSRLISAGWSAQASGDAVAQLEALLAP